jgi:hypothetical protein
MERVYFPTGTLELDRKSGAAIPPWGLRRLLKKRRQTDPAYEVAENAMLSPGIRLQGGLRSAKAFPH